MEGSKTRSLRNAGAWAITAGGHLVLLWVGMLAYRQGSSERSHVQLEPVLVMINMPQRAVTNLPMNSLPARHNAVHLPTPATAADVQVHVVETPPSGIRIDSLIDWKREATFAAQAATTAAGRSKSRAFGEPLAADTVPCKRGTAAFAWKRELKKAGFLGGLPYVRLGKRCIVGLPFFGCALGHLPEANTHLFDNMNATDRPVSSVPAMPDCVPAPD